MPQVTLGFPVPVGLQFPTPAPDPVLLHTIGVRSPFSRPGEGLQPPGPILPLDLLGQADTMFTSLGCQGNLSRTPDRCLGGQPLREARLTLTTEPCDDPVEQGPLDSLEAPFIIPALLGSSCLSLIAQNRSVLILVGGDLAAGDPGAG